MKSQAASGAPRPLSPARATALMLAVAVAAPYAEAQVLQSTSARSGETTTIASTASTVEQRPNEVQLLVGRSTVLNVGQPITRVSLTSPDVADAMVTAHQQLLVHGKAPGTITMFVWDRSGGIRRYEVVVQRDLSQLVHQIEQLFPGEPITVTGNGEHVVIAGTVSSKYVVDKAAEVAAGYVKKAEEVVNLLKQQEGIASQQVLLRVRFAEVSRTALTELGSSFFANGFKDGRWFGRTSTQQFPAPDFDSDNGGLVFSDFLNLFVFDMKNGLGGVIKALQNKGLFQSLAEPNLIAENGKEASFLAGGEYPYPVVQGTGGGTSVSIQFKEFGVKLNFTPTLVGDSLIHLKVRPEVSSLDFSNGLTVQGFRVPALTTRRTETEVELQDGQTFAIAGLMSNTVSSTMSKIPGIGDIPILGLLFRSKAAQKAQTELVVMITPTILRRNSTGVSPSLPNIVEPFMGPSRKSMQPPAPWNPGDEPQVRTAPSASPSPAATPAARPVSQPAATESAPAQPAAVSDNAPATTAPATPAAEARPAKLTKQQKAALERAQKEEKERRKIAAQLAKEDREAAARQARRDREAAEQQAKLDRRREAEARKQNAKMAREQAKLEAELSQRRQEAEKRQAEEDRKRAAQLAEAEQRLKAAQAEYQSALGDDSK
jgi:pilus assembly protein CpaC